MRDERPLKLLRRTPVDADHVDAMVALAERADALAADAGKDLQSEFGKEHVALIVGCNQFVRFYRDGEHAGRMEVWLSDAADFDVHPAVGGTVFQMFGWRTMDPRDAKAPDAMQAAFARALTTTTSAF
ncbi:MAG: hypothetical protein ACPHID_00765 [Thermoplasmatota archaeon]